MSNRTTTILMSSYLAFSLLACGGSVDADGTAMGASMDAGADTDVDGCVPIPCPAPGWDPETCACRPPDNPPDLPPPVPIACNAGEPWPSSGDYAVQESFHGTNQTYTDSCDEQGNLITYSCVTEDEGAEWESWPVATGEVAERQVDCGGSCEHGACLPGCPEEGALLEVTSATPAGTTVQVTLTETASGARTSCTFEFPQIEACAPYITVGTSFPSGLFYGFCPAGTGEMGVYVQVEPNVTQTCTFSDCAKLSP